jgi:2-methylisocitrate lyase-like PEP mutase family enzyme
MLDQAFFNNKMPVSMSVSLIPPKPKYILAIRRACAYAESGASGFFAPGISDAEQIEKLCERSPLPVNIMVLPYTPTSKQLAQLGVARISYGPGPYREVISVLKENGRKAFSSW